MPYILDDWERLAAQIETLHIEGLGHQCRLPNVEQITGSGILGFRIDADEMFDVFRIQRSDRNETLWRVVSLREKHEVPPIRKKLGIQMPRLVAPFVQLRQGARLAAGSG